MLMEGTFDHNYGGFLIHDTIQISIYKTLFDNKSIHYIKYLDLQKFTFDR